MIKPHVRSVVPSWRPGEAQFWSACARRGLAAADVIVLFVLVVLIVLVLLMVLPRGREHAAHGILPENLSHIGVSLAQYDQIKGRLPGPGDLGGPEVPRELRPSSPLRALLETFEQPSLLDFNDAATRPQPRPGEVPGEMPVPGFICASDPNATAGRFLAPINYRAATGDMPAGENGAFAPGHVIRLQDIQQGDGLTYTAAFSERLTGDTAASHTAARNYFVVPGPLPPLACPPPSRSSIWQGDAGSSWVSSTYASTLYNHALLPNAQPSCIDSGGKAAFMGASSGHVPGVNLLFLDGRVSTVRPSVDEKVWKEFARIGTAQSSD